MLGRVVMSISIVLLGSAGALSEPALDGKDLAPASSEPDHAENFDIREYRVRGNTRLPVSDVEKTVYPFLGPGKTIDDVEAARKALEALYQERGYAACNVDIPEQEVGEGVIVLQVSEGRVDRLKVTGARYFSPGKIREKVPALARGEVLDLPKAQAQLAELAQQSADRKVTPVMRAGRTPGTVEVDLGVEDRLPIHGSLEINGRNSANTSRTRLIGLLRYDNLWQRFHSASLQYQVAPENPSELQVWAGTYTLPIEALDARLAFYGIGLDSSSDVATAGALTVVGTGNIYGLRLVKSLPGLGRLYHSATLGWDYKDFGQAITLSGADSQNTPIAYSPFMLSYGGGFVGEDDSLTQLNVEVDFSIRGLGNNQQEFENKRFGASAGYIYLAGDLRHRQMLPKDFQAQFRFAGQLADSPLISNEQFGAGGWQSVRGYYETQRLGDDGFNASVELHFPDLAAFGPEVVNKWRLLLFGDYARLWIRDSLPGAPGGYDLASWGAGMRLQAFRYLFTELDWAYPLVRADTIGVGDQRVDFRVAYEY